MKSKIVKVILLLVAFSMIMPISNANSDPFPGVANGAEIPGTRVSSPPGQSEADWYASSAYTSHTCPSGSGRGGGVDLAFTTDRSKHVRFVYCVKTWQPQTAIDAQAKYRADRDAAIAAALAQSQAWNAANPGQQKCFQWGPITNPNGGTESGGVCANPVASSAPSGSTSPSSDTKTASTTSTSSGGSTSSSSDTKTASTTSTSSGGSTSSSSDTKTASTTPTPTPSGVTGIDINMFDLQGTSLYARYCIKGSGFVRWSGSIRTTSTIADAGGKIFSQKVSQWGTDGYTSGMSGDCSTWYAYDEIKSGFEPGKTYTLTVNSSIAGANYSLTKSFTIGGGSEPATKSEAVVTQGLGGYAVVHPNGKVCGVIVATSADPYGNGGKMPIEYMGCPIGSRIIFQTTASPTGNVAGWHGENVTYNGSEFLIKSGASDTATVVTKIQAGVATDSNGRVWETGSGKVLKPATTQTDTKTATTQTDTKTATTQTDTKTATTQTDTKTATTSAPAPLAAKIAIPDSNTVQLVLASLTNRATENQLVIYKTGKNRSRVSINTEFANSLLQLTATKKGAKTITLPVQTNSKGDAKLNIKTNLSGYSVSLQAGSKMLDSDKA